MKIGIVVCTRMNSKRIPNKCAVKINGRSILEHLHHRLEATGLPVIYAYPPGEHEKYDQLFWDWKHSPEWKIGDDFSFERYHAGYSSDPLQRMYQAADNHNLDAVIRVTHDKIFVDHDQVYMAIDQFRRKNLDYLYSSQFVQGTGFEIISMKALEKAAEKHQEVEHISYAIKAVTDNQMDWKHGWRPDVPIRLLIDFPEDVEMMTKLFAILGNDCTQAEAIKYLTQNSWLRKSNLMPDCTIYTCVYNGDKWLEKCMESVVTQVGFSRMEYIIIDDHSTDDTAEIASKYATRPNVKYIRNDENIGLSASSNVALAEARGPMIIRMDADDYFTDSLSVWDLATELSTRSLDAVYPSNYFGAFDKVQRGDECHHVGGTLFRTRAINHIKFSEKLRNLEGFEFWHRAKDTLKIGYLNKPLFFYRQDPFSMSHTNLEERAKLRAEIEEEHRV